MKILMVNKFLHPNGGSETYIFKLGKYLSAQGHEVQYFGMEHEGRCVGNRVNAYMSDMDFHSGAKLSKLTYPIKTIYSAEARKKIRLILEDFKPDVVHLNNINFQLTPSIIYEIRNHRIPIIQTVHDVQIACPNHRCYIEHLHKICDQCDTGNYFNCVKNKCIQNSTPKSLIASVESFFYHYKNIYNLVDLYICPSEFIKRKIIKGGVETARIKVMHNFSDKIDRLPKKINSKKYCVYFGRLSKEKGIDTLLELFTELNDIPLKIAGKGPLSPKVQEYNEKYANIDFLGFQTGEELYKTIADAKFSFCCSEWYENCPLSVIESQALGTPVIGSDLGGTSELIEDGKTGVIFKGFDKIAFKNAIITLWRDDNLVEEMSIHCSRVKSRTIDLYTEELVENYKILSDRNEK